MKSISPPDNPTVVLWFQAIGPFAECMKVVKGMKKFRKDGFFAELEEIDTRFNSINTMITEDASGKFFHLRGEKFKFHYIAGKDLASVKEFFQVKIFGPPRVKHVDNSKGQTKMVAKETEWTKENEERVAALDAKLAASMKPYQASEKYFVIQETDEGYNVSVPMAYADAHRNAKNSRGCISHVVHAIEKFDRRVDPRTEKVIELKEKIQKLATKNPDAITHDDLQDISSVLVMLKMQVKAYND